jgi:hypothetical protein
VSFLQKAKDAAALAGEQAKAAAAQAGGQARALADRAGDEETQARARAQAGVAGAKAKVAIGTARRGLNTIVERIDPGVLADLIIKATALQEVTNRELRKKRSPYRIQEITITATIPPGVNFAIGRVGDIDDDAPSVADSVMLVAEQGLDAETILSLDAEGEVESGDLADEDPAGPA